MVLLSVVVVVVVCSMCFTVSSKLCLRSSQDFSVLVCLFCRYFIVFASYLFVFFNFFLTVVVPVDFFF